MSHNNKRQVILATITIVAMVIAVALSVWGVWTIYHREMGWNLAAPLFAGLTAYIGRIALTGVVITALTSPGKAPAPAYLLSDSPGTPIVPVDLRAIVTAQLATEGGVELQFGWKVAGAVLFSRLAVLFMSFGASAFECVTSTGCTNTYSTMVSVGFLLLVILGALAIWYIVVREVVARLRLAL